MDDRSLYAPSGTEIPVFSKDIDYFLNRSVMLYGASNSGKSTIIRDILHKLKDYIPNVCVICPTNNLNGSYNGLIPKPLIHTEVKENLLDDILKRQEVNVKIFNLINNLDKLEFLYKNLYKKDNLKLQKILSSYDSVKSKLTEIGSGKKFELEIVHKKELKKFYKHEIHKNIKYLDKMDLSKNDKILIKHIYINPNFLLIIDDAAVNATTWCKFNSVKELFFNGRHHRVTFMIAFQDDKLLESSLRKNAFINIFTTDKVCNAFFERPANNFTRAEKNKMIDLVNAVFKEKKSDGKKNYKKLVYLRECTPTTYYMEAGLVEDFKFGSEYLINYCNKIQKDEREIDMDDFQDFF
jgi:hypothetical protein